MKNIISNIRTTASLFHDVSAARKSGAIAVQLRPLYRMPVVDTGAGFYDTPEGCLLNKCRAGILKPVKDYFHALPRETRHALTFGPKHGEYITRVQFWRCSLRDILPPAEYHYVIGAIVRWFRICRYFEIADAPQQRIDYEERLTGRTLSERERELFYLAEAARR